LLKKLRDQTALVQVDGQDDLYREIVRYANHPFINKWLADSNEDELFDPLQFYRIYNKEFPKLSFLVSHWFCIQASSVASEELFSNAGLISTDLRNRLHPQRLEKYAFLRANQSEYNL
jgi:hypothetical protein